MWWLAHAGSAQGLAAVHHAFGAGERPVDPDRMPGCIFTDPEVATVGPGEDQWRERGVPVRVGAARYIANGKAGFDVSAGFASNGYGAHSPGGYTLLAALLTEVVMTLMFLVVILGATDERAPKGLAPIAIGLCLTLIHLISIPVTNTSVNPARSTGVALFVGGWAVEQLWLFWVAPIFGAVLGALIYRFIGGGRGRE